MDYEKIGKRIKKYREAAEMTQENLGEASHYSPQHISKVENAQTKPSLQCILSIANALQISIDELVCGNVSASSVILDKEIQELLEDCSPQEKYIILEIVKVLKTNLKNLIQDMEMFTERWK